MLLFVEACSQNQHDQLISFKCGFPVLCFPTWAVYLGNELK